MRKELETRDIDPSTDPMGWWNDRMGYEPTPQERERLRIMAEELRSVSGQRVDSGSIIRMLLREPKPKFEPLY